MKTTTTEEQKKYEERSLGIYKEYDHVFTISKSSSSRVGRRRIFRARNLLSRSGILFVSIAYDLTSGVIEQLIKSDRFFV